CLKRSGVCRCLEESQLDVASKYLKVLWPHFLLVYVCSSPRMLGWDQFEANAALFGVKSTFKEELYTTKLDRGPQMRELEKRSLKISQGNRGGIHFHDKFDLDEETKYSSVFRGVDDSGYDEDGDILDSQNSQTFGDASDSLPNKAQLTSNFATSFGCRLGEEAGYAIRFEDCTGPETVIKYMIDVVRELAIILPASVATVGYAKLSPYPTSEPGTEPNCTCLVQVQIVLGNRSMSFSFQKPFLDLVWSGLAICKTTKETPKPIIAEQIPKFKIDSVEFEMLTLGSLPPTFYVAAASEEI
ncbi:hypothetical protein M8C21_003639, partial [Ambrosia artemisiifolia]